LIEFADAYRQTAYNVGYCFISSQLYYSYRIWLDILCTESSWKTYIPRRNLHFFWNYFFEKILYGYTDGLSTLTLQSLLSSVMLLKLLRVC